MFKLPKKGLAAAATAGQYKAKAAAEGQMLLLYTKQGTMP